MDTQMKKKNIVLRFLDDVWFKPQPAVVLLVIIILIFIAVILANK